MRRDLFIFAKHCFGDIYSLFINVTDGIRHIRLCYYLMPMCNAYLFIHSLIHPHSRFWALSLSISLSCRTLDEIVSDEMRWARTNQKLQTHFQTVFIIIGPKAKHHATSKHQFDSHHIFLPIGLFFMPTFRGDRHSTVQRMREMCATLCRGIR